MKFGPKTAENGWRVLPTTSILTAWTLYNGHQANFGRCYVVARAYSRGQQNAGRAQDGLCHASSSEMLVYMRTNYKLTASHITGRNE